MIGRFIRFYTGYTAESALQMPARRFWALYDALPALRAEELREQLSVLAAAANPGEDGAAYREMLERLDEIAGDAGAPGPGARSGGRQAPAGQEIAVGLPGVTFEAEPGSIAAERERQKAHWLQRVAEAAAAGIHINT